jgi:uncharacterized repeat protein (TIGR02543 family)
MSILTLFKVNVLKKGIYVNIYLEDEKINKSKKYYPYGYQLKNDFDKPGYQSNWKSSENSDSFFELNITETEFPNKEYTFFLSYTKKIIILKFILNHEIHSQIEGKFDDEIHFPQIDFDKGYDLEGYYLDENFSEKFIDKKYPAISRDIFIKTKEVRYPIYYQGIEEKFNNKNNPRYVTHNQKINLFPPNLPGFDFFGWYENPKFTRDKVEKLEKIDYDVYLFPKLNKKTFKIKFLSNNTELIPQLEIKFGEKIEFKEKPLNKEGFTFDSWLYRGEKLNLKLMPAHDLNLEAKWIPLNYNITLNYNYDGKTQNITYNRLKEEVSIDFPIRDGYSFIGWYLDSTFTSSKIAIVRTIAMKNINLYAKWDIKTHKVRLFNEDILYKELTIQDGKRVSIENFELKKEGLIFNGWSLNRTVFEPYESSHLIYKDLNLYSNFGKYVEITKNEYLISDKGNFIEIKFNLKNSCNIMKHEFVDLVINIHAIHRNSSEEDFYFENSIERSNVWATDINLISSKLMNASVIKQIKPKDLKHYSLNVQKNRLVYYFPGNIQNILNIYIKEKDNILFKNQLIFNNSSGNLLNSLENTLKFAIENTLKYIIAVQKECFGKVLESQVTSLNDFQKQYLDSDEKLNIKTLVNATSISQKSTLRENLIYGMKKSLTVTMIINQIREEFIKIILMNDHFKDELLEDIKSFSEHFGFDVEDTFNKISSGLKDSNIKLSLNLFNIQESYTKEEKLVKINKKYLEFSKKIISSNKQISTKAKEVVLFLAQERKKLEK